MNNEFPDSRSIIASIAARSIPSIPALSDADTTKSDMLNFVRVGLVVDRILSSILTMVFVLKALSDVSCIIPFRSSLILSLLYPNVATSFDGSKTLRCSSADRLRFILYGLRKSVFSMISPDRYSQLLMLPQKFIPHTYNQKLGYFITDAFTYQLCKMESSTGKKRNTY